MSGAPTTTSPTSVIPAGYVTKIIYDANNNPIYIGKAPPGYTTAQASWQIKRITYNASQNPTNIEWAEGVDTFNKVMDDYLSYSYS